MTLLYNDTIHNTYCHWAHPETTPSEVLATFPRPIWVSGQEWGWCSVNRHLALGALAETEDSVELKFASHMPVAKQFASDTCCQIIYDGEPFWPTSHWEDLEVDRQRLISGQKFLRATSSLGPQFMHCPSGFEQPSPRYKELVIDRCVKPLIDQGPIKGLIICAYRNPVDTDPDVYCERLKLLADAYEPLGLEQYFIVRPAFHMPNFVDWISKTIRVGKSFGHVGLHIWEHPDTVWNDDFMSLYLWLYTYHKPLPLRFKNSKTWAK
jgi:hypothetical protein